MHSHLGKRVRENLIAVERRPLARFVCLSAVGVTAFFLPISLGGTTTILVDHIVTSLTRAAPLICGAYTAALIVWGVMRPFVTNEWGDSPTTRVLSVIQVLAIPLAFMYFAEVGFDVVVAPDILPFLFEKLAIPVGLVIPIGAVFLTFLMDFGLLEAIGALMNRVMRPAFKTPGRSAVDAMASFVGSYSVGLLITNRVYESGRYSAKEAAIIATGFSTVSATFMVIVAKTLSLTDAWLPYFFGTLVITFVVTAITVRLPPLAGMDDRPDLSDEVESGGSVFKSAFRSGLEAAGATQQIAPLFFKNLSDGLRMASRVVPSILAMGFLGLMAANHTPVFEILGYLLTPVVWLFNSTGAHEIAAVLASGLAEMFLPAMQSAEFERSTRFVVGVVSVSSILFLSASIPCVLATSIPLTLAQMVCIWGLRTLLSIPLAYAAAWIFGYI